MKSNPGVEVELITAGGLAERAGLLPGDRIIRVNGRQVRDAIDLMFYSNEPVLQFTIGRNGTRYLIDASRAGDESIGLGIELKPFHTRACRNNCLFCFVSQLPKGLRKSLYLRDDDYRMSFLYGNYITMTNLSAQDRERIIAQHLSPLYISVHSSNTAVRNRMLGVQEAGDIVKEIKLLADNKIRMHTQIVLCPGFNDGRGLEQTLADLYRFYPYVLSIAVVPVGFTAHRKKQLKAVDREDAHAALEIIRRFQNRFRRKHGETIVHAADELYIKAGEDFPPTDDYGEFPQIENGVGMVPLFLHEARKIKLQRLPQVSRQSDRRFITFTGTSFYPYLSKYIGRLRKADINIEVVPVENTFFGTSVTVAGLLTGRDVIKSLSGVVERGDIVLVPDVVLRSEGDLFLDDISLHDVEEVLGTCVISIASTPQGVVDAVADMS